MLVGVVLGYASGVLVAIFEEGIAGNPTLDHAADVRVPIFGDPRRECELLDGAPRRTARRGS
jgi:hypothetical protein|tara:strand:+ start:2868 stop:3053 length:186 start_codon:yes stop_codon:yes gene_type:complete